MAGMALKGVDVGLISMVVLVAMLWNGAMAQSGCTAVLVTLSPCLSYVTGNSSTPSSSCCSQLRSTVQSSPQCLCQLLNGGGAGSLGVAINQTLALALPGACNVQTPPPSQCNAPPAGGVTRSAAAPPVSSPTESPTDSSSNQTPNASPPSDSPSGTGSKIAPSALSGGSLARTPVYVVLLPVFVASWASTATRF